MVSGTASVGVVVGNRAGLDSPPICVAGCAGCPLKGCFALLSFS